VPHNVEHLPGRRSGQAWYGRAPPPKQFADQWSAIASWRSGPGASYVVEADWVLLASDSVVLARELIHAAVA
jgi:hypothetical protein